MQNAAAANQSEATSLSEATIPCNLCGQAEVSVLANINRERKPLRTVICRQCGLVWSDPRPHNAREFYEDDYRVSYKGSFTPKSKHVLRAGKVALDRHRHVEPVLSAAGQAISILDVGSGGGEFAYLLKKLGHQVIGIEPNKGYAGYSISQYELDVRVGFIQDADLPAAGFDLITIWHVLEHTEDPLSVLKLLRSLLKPNGTLVVEVPNIEATCQSPISTFHDAHLYNFNTDTLGALANKAKLKVIRATLSPDGGNTTMTFQQDNGAHGTNGQGSDAEQVAPDLSGNYEKISRIVSRHNAMRHFARLTPYTRAVRRLQRSVVEKREAAGFETGRDLLDRLYAPICERSAV
ncbi:MAG: class I SAM-dependent methyltransferase [Burkholderiaceae bacterium]